MSRKKHVLYTLLILLTIACVGCAGLLLASLQMARPASSATPTSRVASPATSILPSLQETSTPSLFPTGSTPAPQTDIPSGILSQMEEIEQQVIRIRGLQPLASLKRKLLTTEQLRQKVKEDFLKNYTPEEVKKDVLTLSTFGLLPANFDLYGLLLDLYTEQIAGFYDDEAKAMYIIQDEDFLGPQRSTYAHEYTHALQDQNFDFRNGLKITDEHCKLQSEYCAAVQSLVEGDASLTEQFWLLTAATAQDRSQIQEFYQNYQSPVFNAAPEFLRQDFLFPYRQGLDFVLALYQKGSWVAVNAAFRQPPTSTEQILHPEKYPNDTPVALSLPDLTPVLTSYSKMDEGELGEWYTYLLLAYGRDASQRLPESDASRAAEGWGGDHYQIWYDSNQNTTVLILQTRWDDIQQAAEFAQAFARYGTLRWGVPSSQSDGLYWTGTYNSEVAFFQDGAQTTWIIAPEQALMEALLNVLKQPIPVP